MKETMLINLFQDAVHHRGDGTKHTAQGVSGELFGRVLAEETLGQEKTGLKRNWRAEHRSWEQGIDHFAGLFSRVGCTLIVPSSFNNLLKNILAGLGLKANEIDTTMKQATDANGLVHLDKLWRLVSHALSNKEGGQARFAMNIRFLPQLGLLFLRIGASPDKVASVLERHVHSKTSLGLGDIKAMVKELAPGVGVGDKEIRTALERFGIPLEPRNLDGLLAEYHTAIKALTQIQPLQKQVNSQAANTTVKTLLAQALQEKGVPSDKIKTILEGLNVSTIRETALRYERPPTISEDQIRTIIENLRIESKERDDVSLVRQQIISKLKVLPNAKKSKVASSPQGDSNVSLKGTTLLKNMGSSRGATDTWAQRGAHKGASGQGVQKDLWISTTAGIKAGMESRSSSLNLGLDSTTASPFGYRHSVDVGIPGLSHHGGADYVHEAVSRIFQHLKFMVAQGQHESRLLLNTPELGQMDLRVLVKQGHLQVQLGTEHPLAKEIVEGNLNILRQQLNQAGFVVDKLDVMVGLGGGGFEAHSGHGEHRGRFSSLKGQTSNQIFGIQEVSTPTVVLSKEHNLSIVV